MRNGEAGALEEVTETLGPRLLNYVYRLVGDRWAAEDLAQEVFVKLLSQASHFKESDNLSAWLFTVARNLSLNHIRGRNVAARNVPRPPEAARAPDGAT